MQTEIHDYAASSVFGLRQAGVLQRLMDLFDAAAAVSETGRGDDRIPAMAGMSKFDFDIVSAILTAAKAMDGGTRDPSCVDQALHALPKTDVRKLKLRFHPDKLLVQLSRTATEEEAALSTAAFQLFNHIVDKAPRLQEQVKELGAKITTYRASTQTEDTNRGDATAEVALLLKEIRLGKKRNSSRPSASAS